MRVLPKIGKRDVSELLYRLARAAAYNIHSLKRWMLMIGQMLYMCDLMEAKDVRRVHAPDNVMAWSESLKNRTTKRVYNLIHGYGHKLQVVLGKMEGKSRKGLRFAGSSVRRNAAVPSWSTLQKRQHKQRLKEKAGPGVQTHWVDTFCKSIKENEKLGLGVVIIDKKQHLANDKCEADSSGLLGEGFQDKAERDAEYARRKVTLTVPKASTSTKDWAVEVFRVFETDFKLLDEKIAFSEKHVEDR